ncbi:MAG TPA: purine-nucleoside phosphorylase [Spirochaetia bacterium]|nr:purine-nucleoside phosphorylase [Spirochaetia bacterium]
MRVRRAAESVRMSTELSPSVGLVLGSGLSGVADAIPGTEVSFTQIEGFPLPTVSGHRGVLKLNGAVAVMAGRFHYYEGHTMDNVVLPVFLLRALGVRTLIITNAAGGINRDFSPGDIVFISDHINLMGTNPLIGPNDADLGPRFPDLSRLYSPELRRAVRSRIGGRPKEGVYAGLTGPSYETPAEIRMLARLGADMVGMSTVPEAIAAGYLGMDVLGISCITNMAAGILDRRLDHAEVVATGKQVEGEMTRIILLALETLASSVV